MNKIGLRIKYLSFTGIAFLILITLSDGFAQKRIAIKDIPSLVKDNLPQLNAAKAEVEANIYAVKVEKRSLIPDLTVAYQANLATYNNITGMSYPGLMMPISGPPSLNNDFNFVPGSAATALFVWRPFTFGQRKAAVERASAQYKLANANYDEQAFRYQFGAINAYLEAVYFKEIMAANMANIRRYQTSIIQLLELAKNGLRPGVDTLQLQSSLAQARIDFLQNENNYQQKLIELSRLIGSPEYGGNLILADTSFQALNPVFDTTTNAANHPYYNAIAAQKEVSAARLAEVQKLWRPNLDFWSNAYGRGSGINVDGSIDKSEGFNFTRTNLGVGLQLSFPILQYYQIDSKKRQYQEILKADEFRMSQVQLDLKKQVESALVQYKSNVAIAGNTAIRYRSALEVFNSLQISYEAGLVDFTRLAQAQFELQQAEVIQASTNLIIQRSLLDISVAKGNLDLFFTR